MYRDLHILRLALPGTPQAVLTNAEQRRVQRYVWPCGCTGEGADDAALQVICCSPHRDLLGPAIESRKMNQ